MSIVTFWNDDKEQVGKTLTSVAVATKMAIERNLKILLISTAYRDPTMKNCYWVDGVQKKLKLFEKGNNFAVESGVEGLSKLIRANKIQPTIITDYTKVIFKGRLEVLGGYIGAPDKTDEERLVDYKETAECYPELLRLANQYYDMVLVDIDYNLDNEIKKELLKISNLNMYVLTQRLSGLDKYNNLKNTNKEFLSPKYIPVIGKYDKNSKYSKKNITRYLDERKEIVVIPYNTLFFEAAEEASVTELFLKLRDIKDTTDDNYFFINEVQKVTEKIILRLQELQMKMR